MSYAELARKLRSGPAFLEVFVNAHHGLHGSPAAKTMQAMLPPPPDDPRHTSEMEAKLSEILGARLLQARKRAKMTQQQAGDEVGITHSAVGQWERGLELPSLLNLIYIAEAYPASLDWLVWGMGNNLDARVRKLPPILREPLLERLNREIEDAEKLVKRLPTGFSNETVKDDDGRLNSWSAANKAQERPKDKVTVKRSKGGTQ